jgi:hypothetical protein
MTPSPRTAPALVQIAGNAVPANTLGLKPYAELPELVSAVQLFTPFAIQTPSGEQLQGVPGDWLIQGSAGALSICTADHFTRTYQQGTPT